jgi:hypothetical protein
MLDTLVHPASVRRDKQWARLSVVDTAADPAETDFATHGAIFVWFPPACADFPGLCRHVVFASAWQLHLQHTQTGTTGTQGVYIQEVE